MHKTLSELQQQNDNPTNEKRPRNDKNSVTPSTEHRAKGRLCKERYHSITKVPTKVLRVLLPTMSENHRVLSAHHRVLTMQANHRALSSTPADADPHLYHPVVIT